VTETRTRFWASWWSGNYASEGCTKPPFKFWSSGSRLRDDDDEKDDWSICAVVDAASEEDVRALALKHFPDAEFRFFEERPADWQPDTGRFPPHGGQE